MYQFEILALIKTISKRRHRKVVQLSKLRRYPSLESKNIATARAEISGYDNEIAHLMEKI